jgi:chemotaxis protein MotB
MAGVMAVVMLLLVVSVLQQRYAEVRHKQETEKGVAAEQKIVSKVLEDMREKINQMGVGNLIAFDIDAHKITLKDGVFSRGSACITPEANVAISSVQGKIAEYLSKIELGQIVVEGHTDSIPVSKPVTDFTKFCTVYDDNFTLSAARAREARKLLLGNLSDRDAKRITVAGYGDSHTLPNIPSTDGRNRRVEVLFSLVNK